MLNELLLVERGMRDAGIGMTQRHPDVSDAGGKATLVVQLDAKGGIAKVYPLPPGVTPWTMRNGKHNSFPFVQVGIPLWKLDEKERDDFAKIQRTDTTVRCTALTQMAAVAQFDNAAFEKWPAAGLLKSLKERSGALKSIPNNPDVYIASTAIKHFLCAAESADGGKELLGQVVQEIVGHLKQTAQSDWVDIAASLLVGKKNKNEWKSDGALLFEASGFSVCIADSRLVSPLSAALQAASGGEETKEAETARATCALTGVVCELHAGNYPQPTLPAGLGQAYLSAVKNTATPASGRYGQFAADAMPVGGDVIVRLDAALRELTVPERKNKTWRSIPGEAPKKNDLLLAFVRGCLDAPVASVLMDQDADVPDYSEEDGNAATEIASSIAAFEKRTERMVEAVRGQFEGDFTKTPVDLMVLRKLDPGNRKVVYANSLSLHDLKTAAEAWAEGERNVPEWFTLPIYFKGEKKSKQMPPPHVSPLGLIGFYKRTYIRDGGEFANVASVPASEVLRLFLDVGSASSLRVGRFLHLLLVCRTPLLTGSIHALRKGWDEVKKYDLQETLKSVTVLGSLLHKLRGKEDRYMENAAFKLGQLLAAADVVHLGYCEGVRGGQVPPSLLGNQIFNTALNNPEKAFGMLALRWAPYAAWVKEAGHNMAKKTPGEKLSQKEWNIRKALRNAREAGKLTAELTGCFKECKADDAFRAELLLGYMAGIPAAEKESDEE